MNQQTGTVYRPRAASVLAVVLIWMMISPLGTELYAQTADDLPAQPVEAGSDTLSQDPYDAVGEETEPTEAPGISTTVDPWEQFFPPPDARFDWIKIVSGEWLKGELKSLYNFQVEFESDELDTLTFDWDDVKVIRSAGPQAVRYDDPEQGEVPLIAFGQLTLIGDTATIGTGENATTIQRQQIVSIAKGTQKERDFWSGELLLGANVRSGNTEVADGSVFFRIQRRKAENRFYSDYRANFSRTRGVETQNNHRVNSYFDSFRTRRWYWRIIFFEYFRDRFQNVENQLALGTGAGYDIIRTAKTEWDVSAGIGTLYKEAVSVETGESRGNTSPALTFGTLFDTELTKRLDYYFKYTGRIVDEANGQYIHNVVTTLSSDITGSLDLDLTLTWDRTEKPPPAADGSTPDQNDYRFTVGISYEF